LFFHLNQLQNSYLLIPTKQVSFGVLTEKIV